MVKDSGMQEVLGGIPIPTLWKLPALFPSQIFFFFFNFALQEAVKIPINGRKNLPDLGK